MERRGIEEWSGHFGIVPGFRSTASGLRSLLGVRDGIMLIRGK
jgi:hypothetical protein